MRHTETVALDHLTVPVKDLRGARTFYRAALEPLGMKINLDYQTAFGMGSRAENIFWLTRDSRASGGGHYALRVDSREEVDAFHAAALRAGGEDNGEPGPRPDYGPNYYAAFVKDREGNNIEVVCYQSAPRKAAPRKTAKTKRANGKAKAAKAPRRRTRK
jgi:catechol 2,3-dioxygenase-like lactoylglutathione lyase family enzyme